MTILVTGASGFLGGAIARALATRSDVFGLDLVPPAADASWRPLVGPLADIASLHPGGPAPDLVVHCAGVVAAASEADPDLAFAANVEGTRALLAWCRGLARPPRVVFASSVAVFGGGDAVVDEASPVRPNSTYGATKAVAETLVADATRRGEIEGVVVRLPVVAPRPSRIGRAGAGYASPLIRAVREGRPFVAPLPADRAIPVALLASTLDLVLRLSTRPDPPPLAHVPSLAIRGEALVAALERHGITASRLVDFAPDPATESLVAGWPERLASRLPDAVSPGDLATFVADCLAAAGTSYRGVSPDQA